MNRIRPYLRKRLFLLLLALMVTSDSTAQGFDQRIVFASNSDGDSDIYSMDVNGDNLLQLTNHPATDWFPACSPDGRRIAFISERGLTSDLYVMDSDGSNAIRLTQDNLFEARPSWSPDGTKIAFVSTRDGNSHIYLMDTNGRNAVKVTRTPPGIVNGTPSWLTGALVVNRNGKFPTSWGVLKRTRNP